MLDDLVSSTNCNSLSPATTFNDVILEDISSTLSPRNINTKDDNVTMNAEVNNNNKT